MNPKLRTALTFLLASAVHFAIFTYLAIPNIHGIGWLRYLLPRPVITAAIAITVVGVLYGLVSQAPAWRPYLLGVAFAALFLSVFAVVLGFAYTDPVGRNPDAPTFGQYLRQSSTSIPNLAFLVALVAVPVLIAFIGIGFGAIVRRIWIKVIGEPLRRRQVPAG